MSPTAILEQNNVFRLNLAGANWRDLALYRNGEVLKCGSYVCDQKVLPIRGVLEFVVSLLQRAQALPELRKLIKSIVAERNDPTFLNEIVGRVPHALEALVHDGWVSASFDPAIGTTKLAETKTDVIHESLTVHK